MNENKNPTLALISSGMLLLSMCLGVVFHTAAVADVLRVPGQYATIQGAVDAAQANDVIRVAPGTYSENVVIAKADVRLKGRRGATVDGGGLAGIGIHVLGTPESPVRGVKITGFEVRGFERGIVLQHAESCRVHGNEVRDSLDKDPSDGDFNMADGITLIDANINMVSRNYVHDSGHNGVFLLGGFGNTVQSNRIEDNGAQTGDRVAGCGIQLSGGLNEDNDIVVNKIRGAAWGILLGPSGGAVGNLIGQNLVTANRRAGIASRGEGHVANEIRNNRAEGNGLLGLPPSGDFDLFEDGDIDNDWINNKGSSNF